MARVTYCLVIALTCCAGGSSAYVGEWTWFEATDEGFVTRTETAEIGNWETPPQPRYDTPPEVLWHHYETFNIYGYGVEIGNRRRRVLTGAIANSKTQLFRVWGTGTPAWEIEVGGREEIHTAYAENADTCFAIYRNPLEPYESKLCRYNSSSSTPVWTYKPVEGRLSATVGPATPRDGSFVAAINNIENSANQLIIFDSRNGDIIDSVTVTESPANATGPLITTPDGRLIMFRIRCNLYVYEFNGSRLSRRDKLTTNYIKPYHGISPDGKYIAYYDNDAVTVCRLREGRYSSLFEHAEPGRWCGTLVFDGANHLFTSWHDSVTYKRPHITCHSVSPPSSTPVWTYTYKNEIGSHQDLIDEFAVSDDGSRLIAASWGNSSNENPEIEVFNGLTGEYLFGVDTPGSMYCCDITPDGLYATAAGKHIHANVMGWGGDIYCIKVLDDIPVNGPDSFVARAAGDAVRVSWSGTWNDLAGFNLYREGGAAVVDAGRVRINAELITGRSPYVFSDRDVKSGNAYRYWLEAVDLSGARETFGPAEVRLPTKPAAFALHQNVPNPTRGKTTFAFSLAAAGPAAVDVYDLAGRRVWRRDGTFAEGENELEATFDLAPGVYVYRLTAGGEAAAKKMVVIK